MKKFEKIRESKKIARIIKDAKRTGAIKEKERIDESPFILYEPKWFTSSDHEHTDAISYEPTDLWRNGIFGLEPSTDKKIERKVEQIHEDMAELRKYTKGLEKQIVSQTEMITAIIHENNRIKKELKDQKEETQEFLQKNGELFRFMKDKIIEVKRERTEKE